MKKRIFAILLSLCMVIGLLPVTAMAADTVSVTTEAELLAAIESATGTSENPVRITVKADITLNHNIFVDSGKCIVLRGEDRDTTITLADTAELTEGEKQSSMIEIGSKHSEDVTEVTLENITLNANSKARVLAAHGVNTLVTMNENTTITHGGGILQGVGVCLVGSTFVMNGGLIVDNHTTPPTSGYGNSGTIVLYEQASFIMNDGAIKDNVVTRYCGGIYSWGGAKLVSIRNGEITRNTGSYGGGITLLDCPTGALEITGGKICANHNNREDTMFSQNIFIQNTPVLLSGNAVIGDADHQNSGLYFNNKESKIIIITGQLKDKAKIYLLNKQNYEIKGSADYQVTDSDAMKFTMPSAPTIQFYVDAENNQIKWAPGRNIIFKANDGSETPATTKQAVPQGIETALNANTFTRTGYTFAGWNTEQNGGGTAYTDGATIATSEDLTLYAQWTPMHYSISYELNGGTAGVDAPTEHIFDRETTLVDPIRKDYDFGGWYTNNDLSGSKVESLGATAYTDNITLYAKWTKTIGGTTYFVSPVVADYTYTGSAIIPAVTVKAEDGNTVNTVDSNNYTVICNDDSNINAGPANIAVKMGEVEIGTASFTIIPAPLTITADNQSIRVGNALPEFTYTVTGLMDADKENTDLLSGVSASCTGADNSKAGTYTITVSGPKDITNYTITYVSGTLTVSRRSSGSSSSSSEKTYAVSTEKSKNGSVKLSDAKAAKGDTVTITVKPDDGYVLDTLTVVDADGDEVKLKDKGDGKFTFTMPASKITVEATFVLESEVEQPTQPTAHPFADIATGTWIDTAVQYVYANGLMTGMRETEFAPSAATSRAMIWTILARRSGADTTGGANWYEKGQQWAIANGISDGLNPSGSITREQLAVMLWRTVGCPLGAGDLSAFTDANTISDYAVTAMQWAIETGLITGNGSGTLAPKAGATRAETAAMLMRFCEANQ